MFRQEIYFNSNGWSESGINSLKSYLDYDNSISTTQLLIELSDYVSVQVFPKLDHISWGFASSILSLDDRANQEKTVL